MSLKIIGGKAKGRKLKTCKGLFVRPMLGRVKKSLFDIIQDRITGADCLDLFSGTGSLGLEAISRGAKKVTFIEENKFSIKTIEHNIEFLEFEKECNLIAGNVFSVIRKFNKKFDIIFADPPFTNLIIEDILKPVSDSKILADEGLLIIHHPAYNKTFKEVVGILKCSRQANYGQNVLSFYTY